MRRWMLAAAVALAALLPIDGPKDWLVLPARNLHALRVVACDDACRVHRELPLSGRLHSNVAAVPAAGNAPGALWAADDGGAIHRFDLEPGRDGDLGEHGPDVQRVR